MARIELTANAYILEMLAHIGAGHAGLRLDALCSELLAHWVASLSTGAPVAPGTPLLGPRTREVVVQVYDEPARAVEVALEGGGYETTCACVLAVKRTAKLAQANDETGPPSSCDGMSI